MAYTEQGLFGAYKGIIGNLVVYRFNDKITVRSKPAVRQKPATGRLKQNRDSFKRVMECMRGLKSIIRPGFRAVAQGRSAFNAAMSYNMKAYYQSLDPLSGDWIKLSSGTRAGATGIAIEHTRQQLTISWQAAQPGLPHSVNDLALAAAINTSTLLSTTSPMNVTRGSQQLSLPLPSASPGDKIVVLLCFYNPVYNPGSIPEQQASESQLIGVID